MGNWVSVVGGHVFDTVAQYGAPGFFNAQVKFRVALANCIDHSLEPKTV